MPAGGEAKARAFFASMLEMQEEQKPAALAARGGCWFRSGRILVHIGVDQNFVPQRKAHPAFCVRDIDLLAARLKASGYPVTWDETLPSRRRLHTADPFGNRIELLRDGDGFGQK